MVQTGQNAIHSTNDGAARHDPLLFGLCTLAQVDQAKRVKLISFADIDRTVELGNRVP